MAQTYYWITYAIVGVVVATAVTTMSLEYKSTNSLAVRIIARAIFFLVNLIFWPVVLGIWIGTDGVRMV